MAPSMKPLACRLGTTVAAGTDADLLQCCNEFPAFHLTFPAFLSCLSYFSELQRCTGPPNVYCTCTPRASVVSPLILVSDTVALHVIGF